MQVVFRWVCLGEHCEDSVQLGIQRGKEQVACRWRSDGYSGGTMRVTLDDGLGRRRSEAL